MDNFLKQVRMHDTVTLSLKGVGEISFPTAELQQLIEELERKHHGKLAVQIIRYAHDDAVGRCGECGQRINSNYNYCHVCGTKIIWEESNG